MDTIITLQIISMVLSFFSPIIATIPIFLSRIRKSQCCGSNLVLASPKPIKNDTTIVEV